MVPLNSYIETNNLIFLILHYAPGEKLFDYIKNYAKSLPNTPAREVNLENVFNEPKIKHIDLENENIDSIIKTDNSNIEASKIDINTSIIESIEECIENSDNNNHKTELKTDNLNTEMTVNELVIHSQKLLQNVDKALSGVQKLKEVSDDEVNVEIVEETKSVDVKRPVDNTERRIELPTYNRVSQIVIKHNI